jgi:hypothetical protein
MSRDRSSSTKSIRPELARISPSSRIFPWVCLLLLSLVGCGPATATIEGTVSYEGVKVEKGMLTITPMEGSGSVVGCDVKGGTFKVTGVHPGKNLIVVMAVKEVPFARNSEDMAKMAANQTSGIKGLIDPADIIPQNAEGNNLVHEFSVGDNKLDLALTKPK